MKQNPEFKIYSDKKLVPKGTLTTSDINSNYLNHEKFVFYLDNFENFFSSQKRTQKNHAKTETPCQFIHRNNLVNLISIEFTNKTLQIFYN